MEQYERDAREAAAKELEAYAYPHSARWIRDGKKKGDAATAMFEALLPLLATSDLERRALEACKEYARSHAGTDARNLMPYAQHLLSVGRESLAAKKPNGPWRVDGHRAIHESGRSVRFYDESGENHCAACAEWVREQNEREAGR